MGSDSGVLFDELVEIADYFFLLDLFSLGLARVILFIVGILCCVPSFSCYFVSILLVQSWSLISLLAGFDYFWYCILSDFLSIMACPVHLLCVVRLRLVRNFLVPVSYSFLLLQIQVHC